MSNEIEYRFKEEDIILALEYIKSHNLQVVLVDANSKKGFTYPYLLYIPNNPQNTLVMDCVNDYEKEMLPNTVENSLAAEQIYNLFEDRRIISDSIPSAHQKEEDEETTTSRLSERIGRAFNTISILTGKSGLETAPIMIPLIPGYVDDTLEYTLSELSSGTAKKLAPQIVNMIKDAEQLVTQHTGVKLNNKIIAHGHSKSATFANNFSTLHPEMVQATMLSGLQYSTLPIEEIKLHVVEEGEKNENEEFYILNEIPTKKITKTEFEEIMEEYTSTKKDYQRDIEFNDDGTYSLPLNYPLGIADIENYIDLSKFSSGKEEYKKIFARIPKMIISGEREEQVTGHFAYSQGETLDGIKVKTGNNLLPLEDERRIIEIERASMHNRVLEYISATSALFGKSANERLRNYVQLSNLLQLNTQSKIYTGVGHVDIYGSREFGVDSKQYYEGIVSGTIPILNNNGRSERINPIYQLMRRYLVAQNHNEYMKKIHFLEAYGLKYDDGRNTYALPTNPTLLQKVENYLETKSIQKNANMDKIFDELTAEELTDIFEKENNIIFSENEVENVIHEVPPPAVDAAAQQINSDMKNLDNRNNVPSVDEN